MSKYYGNTVVENSGMLKTEWAFSDFARFEVIMEVGGYILYRSPVNEKIVHAVSRFPEKKYGRDDMHQIFKLIHF